MIAADLSLRARAELLYRQRTGGREERQKRRTASERARFAGDPWAYSRDIFGYTLTDQQERALEAMESATRLLIPSGNNLGKTFLLALYGVYTLDAVGAVLDEFGHEQGARVLLTAPDHPTIYSTIYSEMMAHATRAEQRGHAMPGRRSEDSVLWRVRAKWGVESFSPPKEAAKEVAHSASGRHHRIQIGLAEEGQGIQERVWKGFEGMCSSEGNKIISSFNPTESNGPAYQRARSGSYRVLHLDAFDHPNIRRRQMVVPDAIDFRVLDSRVRECRDRGPASATTPETNFGDFIYAVPVLDAPERGAREDAVLGHPDATPHVFRPTPAIEAQVRGQWPRSSDSGLFNPGALDAGMERWRAGQDPPRLPDRLGVDAAREGEDDTCTCPSWGEDAEAVLRAWQAATEARDAGALVELTAARRIRCGEIQTTPKGKGPEVAQHIAVKYSGTTWNVDEGGVGASVLDHAKVVLGLAAYGVSFAGKAPERIPGEFYCENVRAALYVRAAMLLDRGLVDPPFDLLLREEVLAQELVWGSQVVEENGKKERKATVRIKDKDEIKRKIGRSPDRADAWVLSLWRPKVPKPGGAMYLPIGW